MILQVVIQFSLYSKNSVVFQREGSSKFNASYMAGDYNPRGHKNMRTEALWFFITWLVLYQSGRGNTWIAQHKCNPLKY